MKLNLLNTFSEAVLGEFQSETEMLSVRQLYSIRNE